jgi:RNA polymerase sigma-70 factor (ECF subfamily)
MAGQGDRFEVGTFATLPDARLLAIAQQGSRRAFAALCRRHRYGLFVFCRRQVLDRELAEDLVQETLLTAWTRLDSCEHWHGWVYTIAHNKCVSHVRSEAVRSERMPLVELEGLDVTLGPSAVAPSSQEVCEQRAAARGLLVAACRLPPRQLAVVGRRLGGASFREIAVQLRITEKAARQAAYDARRRLRVSEDNAWP